MDKFFLPTFIKAYRDNKVEIGRYITSRKEGYLNGYPDTYRDSLDSDDKKIIGMSIGLFLSLFLLNLTIFIVALIILAKNWKKLPTFVQVICIIMLFFAPLITLVLALLIKK